MDCERFVSEFYRYVDGELRSWKRVTVERHLRSCGSCEETVAFEQALRARVAACWDGDADLPAGLADRIRGLALGAAAEGDGDADADGDAVPTA